MHRLVVPVSLVAALILFVVLRGRRAEDQKIRKKMAVDSITSTQVDGIFRHDNISEGITYSRTILQFPDDGAFELDFVDGGKHCTLRDEYGDNQCHFDWGEKIQGKVTVKLNDPIVEGDYMVGALLIDKFIPYKFRCALCGEDCVLEIPVIKHNQTIPMDKCPISVHETNANVVYQMMDESPTHGKIATKVDGTVQLTQAATGKTLALFSVDGYVK